MHQVYIYIYIYIILRWKILKIKYLVLLITNTILKTKINVVQSEMPIISGLATTATTPTLLEGKYQMLVI